MKSRHGKSIIGWKPHLTKESMLESINLGRKVPMPWDSSTVNMEKHTSLSVVTDLAWAS